jgi:hypothetical protein
MNRTTLEVVTRQAEAMGVDLFEVGLYKPLVEGAGNEPEMLPRTWDKATLLRSVGWLKYQNSQGRNIYIRPKGEHPLSLVDDLTGNAVERMRLEGFQPSVVVETSPGNFQAWLNHGQTLPKAESTGAARALAERFGGDKGAADWRHFGRLAGLTNRKERHRAPDGLYPFVRLTSASPGLVYEARDTFVAHVRSMVERGRQPSVRPANPLSNHTAGRWLLTIDDFRARPEYRADGNRIDIANAVYALSHSVPESEVRAAIASRDLSKKGSEARQVDYIGRTIRKALAATDQKGVARRREPSLTMRRAR